MSLSKWIVLLLILCCSTSCQSEGASGSSSSPCTSTRVYVDEEDSLSAQINRAWCDRKKISIEILFQNNGAEPVQFPLEGLTVEVGGRSVVGERNTWRVDGVGDRFWSHIKPSRAGMYLPRLRLAQANPSRANMFCG